jgi:hypothetical protein
VVDYSIYSQLPFIDGGHPSIHNPSMHYAVVTRDSPIMRAVLSETKNILISLGKMYDNILKDTSHKRFLLAKTSLTLQAEDVIYCTELIKMISNKVITFKFSTF